MTADLFVFPFAGLIFIGLGLPLALRKVGPNGRYGLRVPATFADESVWYDANAATGRDLIVAGAIQFVAWAVLAGRPGLSRHAVSTIAPFVVLVSAGVTVGVGWWRANRLLARRSGRRR